MDNIYYLNDLKNKNQDEIRKILQRDNSIANCNLLIKKVNIIIKALEDEDIDFDYDENKIISVDLEKADIALSNIEDIIIRKLKLGIRI